jgi:uncharacterized protein YndB with AHSA1/START domain
MQMIVDRIEKDIRIAASVEQVWSVLTERMHMEEWFSRGFRVRELDLRPGGLLLLDSESKHATLPARIVTVDPPHVFSYRWAEAYPGSEPTEENSTLVEFRLTSDGDATVLQVTESGYANLVIPTGREYVGFESHSRGWPIFLDEIRGRAEEFALK